jgi:hypothetical protein
MENIQGRRSKDRKERIRVSGELPTFQNDQSTPCGTERKEERLEKNAVYRKSEISHVWW